MSDFHNKGTVVNGVELPDNLVVQLKQLGLELGWYNAWQLEAAVLAHKGDCQLVEDPNGVNFMDKLELTHAERLAAERAASGEEAHLAGGAAG